MPNDHTPDPNAAARTAGADRTTLPPNPELRAEPQAEISAEPKPDPKVLLDHIREVSQTARGSWFALLALLAFVGVTMMAHTDAGFFAVGIATRLPVVGMEVPTTSFFVAAPLLIAAFYIHLQLYLVSLWDALGDAPERIDADSLIDRIHPTMITHSAILYRARRRPDGSSPARAFGRATEAITLLLVWLAAPALIAWMFRSSLVLRDPRLSLWIGACLAAACFVGFEGLRVARGRLSRPGEQRNAVHAPWGVGGWLSAAAFATALFFLYRSATEATYMSFDIIGQASSGMMVAANLREAELTPRPSDWKPFELWLEDRRYGRESDAPGPDPSIPKAEEMKRYLLSIRALNAPVLSGRDLRGADLTLAFLPGADLRRTEMKKATLHRAELQGADLGDARMSYADFVGAQLQGTNLRLAEMQGAHLARAHMQGADLGSVQMRLANLEGALLQGANLESAGMEGVEASKAQIQGANLFHAQMQGANLGEARVQGASLWWAKMQGTNLSRVQMQDADCTDTAFRGALTHGADLSCRIGTLTQEQLEFTVGDAETILPAGLHVWSCLDRAEVPAEVLAEIDAALGLSANFERGGVLFCNANDQDPRRRSPHKVGRHRGPHR